ncbi:MAG: LysR family transcriptional regulator [Bdellovibrio sp.]|nr:MAG: LysR family transcriptional regulator [Bdellovibrio sp.]
MNSVVEHTYELSILAKAIQHKNLSTAANHVGLSQPQLSRLIQRLESVFKVVLLDRSSRRKSGWTTTANDLAKAYLRGMGRFEAEILSVTKDREVNQLRVASLEGLADIAMDFTYHFFEKLNMRKIDLDILDYRELDSSFLAGQLDVIFTARPPSSQKFKYLAEVGYQQNKRISNNHDFLVMSPFEWMQANNSEIQGFKRIIISNSLLIRGRWLEERGGTGTLPVDAKRGKGKGFYSIYMIGNDLLSPKFWEDLLSLT